MIENDLTADYYWGQVETAYRAFRATLPTADAPFDGRAYRDYRDALAEWLRFCYANDPVT